MLFLIRPREFFVLGYTYQRIQGKLYRDDQIFINVYFPPVFFFFGGGAALGLHCCAWAFSSCGKQGLLFVEVHALLIAVASLAVEHGLQARGLSSSGLWALKRRLSSCGTRA